MEFEAEAAALAEGRAAGLERGRAMGRAAGAAHGSTAGRQFGFELGFAAGLVIAARAMRSGDLEKQTVALEHAVNQVDLSASTDENRLQHVRARVRVMEAKAKVPLSIVRSGDGDAY